jgi:hypothetical protein
VRANETIGGVSQDTINPLKGRITIFIGTLYRNKETKDQWTQDQKPLLRRLEVFLGHT